MKEGDEYAENKSQVLVSSVLGNSIALSILIKNIHFSIHSIPQDISNSLFE
jgi:hypothetical protein